MDNTRFDPMRFSPEDLPSLDQLLREQSYSNRTDVDVMSDYARPDPPMQPYPAQGYYAPQQDPSMYGYTAYPYTAPQAAQYGYGQPYPMQSNPYDRSYAPAYPAQDMRRNAQPGYYAQPQRDAQMPQRGYTPYDPDYRPQHMKPDPRFDDPQYDYVPLHQNPYAEPYRPQQPAPAASMQPYAPQTASAMPPAPYYAQQPVHEAPQNENDNNGFDALPSLAQLQQALEEERRVLEAQRREAAQAQQQPPQPVRRPEQPAMDQRPRPAQTSAAQGHIPQQTQPSQRFVIEDLALDDDEEDHTKRKDPLEKTQFSSLLKRFRPKSS